MTSVLLFKSALAVLAVVMTWSAPAPRNMTPNQEAEYIVLDAFEDELLPKEAFIPKIAKTIVEIRKQFPKVANVRNQGNWYLGKVLVTNYSSKLKDKISASKFGPVKSVKVTKNRTNEAQLDFNKPYHPDRLSDELKKLGVDAEAIWFDGKAFPDLGHIRYNPVESTYTFRQGLANCDPKPCTENHFWTFKVDEKTNTITLQSESATSLPVLNY